MEEQPPLVVSRGRTVILAMVALLLGVVVVVASARGVLPPAWDWVKRSVAMVGLAAMASKLLGAGRVRRIRQAMVAGLREPGARLVEGAGEILAGYLK